jgi:hypothetical protein
MQFGRAELVCMHGLDEHEDGHPHNRLTLPGSAFRDASHVTMLTPPIAHDGRIMD